MKRTFKTYSLHKFESRDDLGFDPKKYSKFKHGDKVTARIFGTELANAFCNTPYFAEIIHYQKQVVVLSAPYIFTKTASNTLADYFVAQLNLNIKLMADMLKIDLKSAQTAKIHREKSYDTEYGLLSGEDRELIMASDKFHTDGVYLKDKACIHIDDVIISGGHKRRIERMIEDDPNLAPNPFTYFVFYAELVDPEADSTIEHYLNSAFVKSLLDVNNIIQDGHFTFNTRVIKFILSSNTSDCYYFLNYQTKVFLQTLLHYAMGNNYHQMDRYKENMNLILQTLDSK